MNIVITLFVLSLVFFSLPVIHAVYKDAQENAKRREAERIRLAREKEAERIKAEKAEADQKAKAEREREKARKAAERAEKAERVKAEREARIERDRQEREANLSAAKALKDAVNEYKKALGAAPSAPPVVRVAPSAFRGNNAFSGEVVAFTGKIDGMTRAEAIKAVEDNGGKAFESMPASTTILVVGDQPGTDKLDKADRWIGQVRKITQTQFKSMLAAPLTLNLDEFASAFAPIH